jgi:hypothetical protein
MVFYGVVSAQTERVVEFFLLREAAEAMIARFGRMSRCWRRSCGSRRSRSKKSFQKKVRMAWS